MGAHVVYAKKERSTDPVLNELEPKHKRQDVVIYKDRECKEIYCRFRWDKSNKPTKRNRWVTINCYTYRLEWL
jgi:hypothetical protein